MVSKNRAESGAGPAAKHESANGTGWNIWLTLHVVHHCRKKSKRPAIRTRLSNASAWLANPFSIGAFEQTLHEIRRTHRCRFCAADERCEPITQPQGRGAGVGRGLGVGALRGVGVGLGVGLGVPVAVGLAVGVGVGVPPPQNPVIVTV